MDSDKLAKAVGKDLFASDESDVWAILDGASVPRLPQLLWEHAPENVCLYRGELKPDLAAMAPYLVKMQPGAPFADLVLAKGWGNHWGVFAIVPSETTLKDLRKHFRRYLKVYSPEGKPIYFRYYDPRVLRAYLPTCNAEEMDFLFGPVQYFYMESEDPETALRFRRGDGVPAQDSRGVAELA